MAQDEGEDAKSTAIREAKEELQVDIPLDELSEHAAFREESGLLVKTFTHPTTYEKLLEFQSNQHNACHFGAEITGVVLPHLVDYGDHGWEGGLINLLKTPAPPSVPHELSLLVQKLGFYGIDKIHQLEDQLGYSLVKD